MNAIHQDKTSDGLATNTDVEDELRELVRREVAATMSKPPAETAAAPDISPPLVPLIGNAGATTIDAIERLIAELQETRDYLKTEAERLARASTRYAQMSQSASASVQIISETLQQWRKGSA